MVNTFLTDSNVERSARSLDLARCGKQRVEAMQILNILQDLHLIAEYYGLDKMPQRKCSNNDDIAQLFLDRGEWVKEIRKLYLASNSRLMYYWNLQEKKLDLYEINREESKKYTTLYGQELEMTETELIGKKSTFSRLTTLSGKRGERIISLGFSQHAVVRMWVGYEEALKEYINIHIDEWCSRLRKTGEKCSNTMKRYRIRKNIIRPWWYTYSGLILSHKASLLRKERDRKEKPWYVLNKSFDNVRKGTDRKWLKYGYCWPSNLSKEIIIEILGGKQVHPKFVTVPLILE